jgi:acetyltransferase-like isoleucine patch superfamily enzyme
MLAHTIGIQESPRHADDWLIAPFHDQPRLLGDEGHQRSLKIFFVGRYADNTIETVTAKLIPMTLRPNMSATFSELGGKYSLSFVMEATAALARHFEAGPALSVAYTKRSVSFNAGTVEEALGLLQEKLNSGYKELFKNEAVPKGRPIEYKITWDPEIRGKIETLNKDSNAPNEKSHFVSNPQLQIGSFIMQILQSSPKLQARIGESLAGLRKEGHPNIFVPVIVPNVLKLKDKVVIHYHVAVNKGGVQNTIEFDYYFADAGKNVDILSYEVKFQALGAWAPLKTEVGHDLAFNRSSNVPKERPKIYKDNIVTPDTTRTGNTVDVQRSELEYGPNDVRIPPRVSASERAGYNNSPYSATPSIRMASAVMDDFKSAIAFNQLFEIRGNLDLLDASTGYPDGSEVPGLTGGQNIWIKVNIWMPDPRSSTGKRQFYYTGKYQLISVENVFSGGQFRQNLTVLATPESEAA